MRPLIGIKVDPQIMGELLAEMDAARNLDEYGIPITTARMTPAELEMFKEHLVKEGVYSQYVWERQKKQVKKMFREAFS